MATLAEVQEKLPGGLDEWDSDKINGLLAEGLSSARILNRAWLAKAAATSEMVDVSESGSSRSMSGIHQNALRMAEYWGTIADKEDDQGATGNKSRSRTHRARRV